MAAMGRPQSGLIVLPLRQACLPQGIRQGKKHGGLKSRQHRKPADSERGIKRKDALRYAVRFLLVSNTLKTCL
jgi:hypothetical protein